MSATPEAQSTPDQQPGYVDHSKQLADQLAAIKADSVTQKLQPGETPQQAIMRNKAESARQQEIADSATNPVIASNARWEALATTAEADALGEVHGVLPEAAPAPAEIAPPAPAVAAAETAAPEAVPVEVPNNVIPFPERRAANLPTPPDGEGESAAQASG
jgi:hypothetical protein